MFSLGGDETPRYLARSIRVLGMICYGEVHTRMSCKGYVVRRGRFLVSGFLGLQVNYVQVVGPSWACFVKAED